MQTITIAGQTYPCRPTMGAFVRFKRATGRDVSQLDQTDISDNLLFLHCCLRSACNADGVACDIDFDTFADSLEPTALQQLQESMAADQPTTEKKAPTKR